ncbi:MAG: class I SAM-dependent methyltransferase [Spirochaetia bacterium]|jgi:SAM-dependent methyltransferase|nr:class I SAM-dependent methyltransferase [Spirochaetia bacterium]
MAPSKPKTLGTPAASGQNGRAWFDDDGFWQDYAPILFGQERWAEAPAVVDSVLTLAGTAEGASVLDVCCGPGRHAIAFASRAHPVVGIDITVSYIEAARETARSMGLSAEFIHADARTWSRPGAFGLAVNLFTSFGYFDTKAEDEAMLARIRDNLAPGGSLVIELVGKELAVRDFIQGERFERDGRLIMTEFQVIGPWESLRNRWIIVDGDRRIDRFWVQRLYSATELRDSLLRSGFGSVSLYGSYEGAAYDHNAKRLIAVARAPQA